MEEYSIQIQEYCYLSNTLLLINGADIGKLQHFAANIAQCDKSGIPA